MGSSRAKWPKIRRDTNLRCPPFDANVSDEHGLSSMGGCPTTGMPVLRQSNWERAEVRLDDGSRSQLAARPPMMAVRPDTPLTGFNRSVMAAERAA